jgi:hypothetical protein
MCNRYVTWIFRVTVYLCALYLREAEARPCLGGFWGSTSVSTCWACDGLNYWMKTLDINGNLYAQNEYHMSTFMGDCICREGTKGSRNGVTPRCTIIPINTYWGYHKVVGGGWWEGPQGYWETTATPCPANTRTNYNAPVPNDDGDITGYQMAGANSIAGCLCNKGYSGNQATVCTPCDAGRYKNTIASDVACTRCVAGTYSTDTGATSESTCTDCPAGKYSSVIGLASSCTDCIAGKYSSDTGATSVSTCTTCSAGTYSALGAGVCTDCIAGTYSPDTGEVSVSTCTNCTAGTYSTISRATSESSCVPCNRGKYSTDVGATSESTCVTCNPGKYSTISGAASVDVCETCDAGKYNPDYGAGLESNCQNCLEGKYSPGTGAVSASTCTTCLAGTYSALGAGVCTDCIAGTYSPGTGAVSVSNCTTCLEGTYSALGAGVCTDCLAGTHSTATGATSVGTCTTCLAGTYSALGADVCTNCLAGTYSTETGAGLASTCINCPTGTYSTLGSGVCMTCGAGSYTTSAASCMECPTGTYTTTEASASCLLCPRGTSSIAGSSQLTACKCMLGYMAPSDGVECNPVLSFQLGNTGTVGMVGASLSQMGDNLHIIDLGVGRKPVHVSLSSGATIVLFDNGDVVGFGENYNGALGNGASVDDEDNYYVGRTAGEMGDNIPLISFGNRVKVKALASNGLNSRCVVLDSNDIKCWGGNANGNLGLGDMITRGAAPDQMGTDLSVVDLGHTLPASVGVGQQPTCIACEHASLWDTIASVPNTAISIPRDAATTTGNWVVSPECSPMHQGGNTCYNRTECTLALVEGREMPEECWAGV